MSFKQTFAIVVAMLALTGSAFAAGAPPSNVQKVQATVSDNKLTVTWASATDADGIDFYRVYFSHQSILGNEGNYDDFERTKGPDTSYVFTKMPLKEGKIFVSVLAVNKAGIESDGFESEASVDAKAAMVTAPTPEVMKPVEPPANQPMPSGNAPTSTAEPMAVSDVHALSETGVLVTFVKPVSLSVQLAADAFSLTDTGGTVLPITGIEVNGASVLLHTLPQKPHTRYVFALMQNVQAVDGTNVTPTAPHIAFDGFGASMPAVAQQYGKNPTQNPPQAPQYGKNPAIAPAQTGYVGRPNAPPEDATNLELTPMRLNDGRYNVIARWMGSADTKRTLDSYLLFTGQNGNAYAFDSAVAKDLTSVQYSRVSPGTFAVKVATRDASGNQSQGIDRVITLPASGLGLFGILAASGAAAGQRLRRKREDEQC